MIWSNWRVALYALQIIAEQGPGLAFAQQEQAEDDAWAASMRALGG